MEDYVMFLKEVLSVQTKSKNEKRMKRFIRSFIRELGLIPEHDNMGNIYCHKGDRRKNRPYVISHMDTVHQVNKNVKTFLEGDVIFAFDPVVGEQYGVGGDDKVGVWSTLCALRDFDNISVAFFVQEEIGCIGSSNAKMSHFKKANWIAQLDRKEAEDFIVYNMASKEFQKDMKYIVEDAGMKITTQSTITDASTLARLRVGVSCVNIASGYYNPHRNTEIVRVSEAINSLYLLYNMIEKFGHKKYEHEVPAPPKPRALPKTKGSLRGSLRGRYGGIGGAGINYGSGGGVVYSYSRWSELYQRYVLYDRDRNPVAYQDTYGRISHTPPVALFNKASNKGDFDNVEDYVKNRPEREEEIKTYHDYEEERYSEQELMKAIDYSDSYNDVMDEQYEQDEEVPEDPDLLEVAQLYAVDELERVLSLFGYDFSSFVQGSIPEDVIEWCSSQLYFETNRTLKYYEKLFGMEGTYQKASSMGWGRFSDDYSDNKIGYNYTGKMPF